MSVHAHTSRGIDAPTDVVWSVLDDFPRVSAWSAGIQDSYTTGDHATVTGLGAERRCELGGKKIVDIWNVQGLPMESSQVTFSVRSTGPTTSEVTIDAEAHLKMPGILVKVMGPLAVKPLTKNFSRLLDELAEEAEHRKLAA
jgi:carbon monoxide dehydrogenase subunit G